MDLDEMGVSGGPPRSISRNPFLRPSTGHGEQPQTQPTSRSAIEFFNGMSRADIFSSNFTGTSENHQLGGNVTVHNYMTLPTPPSTPASSSNITCDPDSSRQSPPSASPYFARADAQNLEINLPPDAPHHSEAYAKLLIPKRRGIPLWDPEPKQNLPAAYRRTGVRIGDVGLVTPRGDFDFLFNICVRADDEINERGVPDGFKPVSIRQNDIYQKNFSWQYCANGSIRALDNQTCVSPFRISFEGRAERGAVLVLPEGGMEEDYEGPNILFDYAGRNAQSWYEFANKVRNRDTFNGSLYLITGSTKVPSWGTAVWQGAIGNGTIPLKFSESPANNASFTYPFAWDSSRIQDTTSQGPQSPGSGPITARLANQSVFLRGYTVMLAQKSWTELVVSVELKSVTGSPTILLPSQVVQGSSTTVSSEGSSNPHWTRARGFTTGQQACSPTDYTRLSSVGPPSEHSLHPSREIARYLLDENATARVAIVHDDIWCSVVEESEASLPPVNELLARISKKYKSYIDANDVANLSAYSQMDYAESRQAPTMALKAAKKEIDEKFTTGASSDSGSQLDSFHWNVDVTRSIQSLAEKQATHSVTNFDFTKGKMWQDYSPPVSGFTLPEVGSTHEGIDGDQEATDLRVRLQGIQETTGPRFWLDPRRRFAQTDLSPAGSSSNFSPLTMSGSELSTPYSLASSPIVDIAELSPPYFVDQSPLGLRSSSPSESRERWSSPSDWSSVLSRLPDTKLAPAIPRSKVGTLATRDATLRRRILPSSARLFYCAVPGCGQDFTRKKNLMNHMNSHLDIRPFQCPTCGQRFVTKYTMTRHRKAKHGLGVRESQASPVLTSERPAPPTTSVAPSQSPVPFRPTLETRLIAAPAIHKRPNETCSPPRSVVYHNVKSEPLDSFDFKVPAMPLWNPALMAFPTPAPSYASLLSSPPEKTWSFAPWI